LRLIIEVTAAIDTAAQTVERERAKALDLSATPDAVAVLNAELARDRLSATLPRLQRLLAEAEDREYAQRWDARFRRAESMVEEAAAKFSRYRELAAAMLELLQLAEQVDNEVDQVNASAASGEMRRLRGVELSARNLNHFTAHQPPIGRELKLPDWHSSSQLVWPLPHNVLDPSVFIMPVQRGDPRATSDQWWMIGEQQRAAEAERQQR
jgi:hypothetical protein